MAPAQAAPLLGSGICPAPLPLCPSEALAPLAGGQRSGPGYLGWFEVMGGCFYSVLSVINVPDRLYLKRV